MRVLLISPEAGNWPFPSGLADTVNQLVRAYKAEGLEIRAYSPCFKCRLDEETPYPIVFEGQELVRGEAYQVCHRPGEVHYHISHEAYFHRPGLYNDGEQLPYWDNHYRFSMLVSGALHHASHTGFIPDVVHAHEWGGALAGALMRGAYSRYFANIPMWLTIHNMEYDFHFLEQDIERIGLDRRDFNLDGYEFWGKVSMLKAGILYAAKVTVTSMGYRGQLLHRDLPGGIRGFLEIHLGKLHGIQHGVDYAYWDVFGNRGQTLGEAKALAKKKLQDSLGLPVSSDFVLYCHLDKETAATAETLFTVLYDLMSMPLQLVLGVVGNHHDREYLQSLARQQPQKIALLEMQPVSDGMRMAVAGSDALFLSHTEEPSASVILKAMASGTLAITGEDCGCSSLLIPFDQGNPEVANALMVEDAWPDQLLREVRTAIDLYTNDPAGWTQLRANAYTLRQTWTGTVRSYLDLLK